jgi:DNA-binding XRE family transcriptional regulator
VKTRVSSKSHRAFRAELLADPTVKAAYDALEPELALFLELRRARERAGLSQATVAQRMGTKAPAVSRIEAAGTTGPSPSVRTLQKYAAAVGCRLDVRRRPERGGRGRRRRRKAPGRAA